MIYIQIAVSLMVMILNVLTVIKVTQYKRILKTHKIKVNGSTYDVDLVCKDNCTTKKVEKFLQSLPDGDELADSVKKLLAAKFMGKED